VFERYGVITGDKATYLHGPPIQVQWNIGSFIMERRECSNDDSVFSEPVAWLYGGEQLECYIAS